MVQVTAKPREADQKMSEEKRTKEVPGGKAPKPELQAMRFDWTGLPVGPGSDILFYKPNQRRSGDLPQGIQPMPAIWLPSPHGAPWHYSGLTEENLVNGHPAPSPPLGWHGTKHIFACGGLIVVLLMLFSYLDRFRLLSRFRPRRSQVQNTLKVICQLRNEQSAPKLPSKSNDPSTGELPPSYSEIDITTDTAPKPGKPNARIPACSCIFASARGKIPRVLFFNTRKNKGQMEKISLNRMKGQPFTSQHMKNNALNQVDVINSKKQMTNFVIEITDEKDCNSVIDMDVIVHENREDAIIIEDPNLPFSVTVEQSNRNNSKSIKKTNVDVMK